MATSYHKRDFFKYIAPHASGVAEPTVEDAVEDVIIDFCKRSSIYRQWLEDYIYIAVDDKEVELEPPRSTAIVEVVAVQEIDDDRNPQGFIGPDMYLFSAQSDDIPKLLFVKPSSEAYEARVRVALAPEVGFELVPNWLYERWRDALVHGVLYRLLSMRSKPWYDLAASSQHLHWYERNIYKAASQAVLETINKIKKPVSRYI